MYFLTNVLMIPMQQALSPIQPPQKYLQDSTRCKRLNSALIEMIVTDLQPISIVEDKRFLRYPSLINATCPRAGELSQGGCYLKNTRKSSQT